MGSLFYKDETFLVQLLDKVKEEYEKEKKDLLLKADDVLPTPMKIVKLPETGSYKVSDVYAGSLGHDGSKWFYNSSYYGGEKQIETEKGLVERKQKALEVIDKYIADCTKVYNENLPAMENNKKIVEKVTALMSKLGIPSSYSHSYFKTNRSRNKTTETVKAGYLGDLQRNVPTYQPAIPDKDTYIRKAEHYFGKLLAEVQKKDKESAEYQRKQEEIHQVALLRAKYTPNDAQSSVWDIREAILSKDKYLRLAYWLERNRGDWNDGYSYAETGLDGFVVEEGNSLDQDIYDNIYSCIRSGDDGDIDGRIFRDTEYNYNRLKDFVTNSSLLEDLEKLNQWQPDN